MCEYLFSILPTSVLGVEGKREVTVFLEGGMLCFVVFSCFFFVSCRGRGQFLCTVPVCDNKMLNLGKMYVYTKEYSFTTYQ